MTIDNQSLKRDIKLIIEYTDGAVSEYMITEKQLAIFNYEVTDSSQKWVSLELDNQVNFIRIDMIRNYSYRKIEEENNEGKCEEKIKKD